MKRKVTALIMAGGRGERFWPKSRKDLPKQFLSLTSDGKTMIQLTVERILPLVDGIEDIFVVTNKDYQEIVREQLPTLPEENILGEPVGRNTAPCIGLAAMYIAKKYTDAIMLVFPSDHMIKYTKMFEKTLEDACEVAQDGSNLVTLGITPDYPETGYGYIKFSQNNNYKRAYKVDKFVEKPNVELAKEYLASEEYLWNSGMFVWKVSTILENIAKYTPSIYQGLLEISKWIGSQEEETVLEREYMKFVPTSIDVGIMEKADSIYTIPGNFGWDDVGSWLAVERIKKSNELGNVVEGNVITIDTNSCIIQGTQKLIATLGIKNLIIIDTEDATLICDKQSSNDIKKIIENLKICNRNEYI